MNRIAYTFVLINAFCFSITAQKSEIKVFPQDNQEFTGEKIIHRLVSNGVEILDVQTNFSPQSHVMGFFIDPVKYMGIGQGMILSTGVVDNVTGKNEQENYTSMELVEIVEDKSFDQNFDVASSEKETSFSIYSNEYSTSTGQTSSAIDTNSINKIIPNLIKAGDPDLSKEIKGLKTFDARVIEVKFVPTADSIYYRYVFASEEYDEYVCSQFNDIFAFYLFQEGQKKKNVAIVPNQKVPVSINTVNNGNPQNPNCQKSNSYLYQKNNGKQNLLYDGFTKVLDIREKVTPGEAYFLKIAIADASDGFWDSAVLLESGSIFSYFESFEISFDLDDSQTRENQKLQEILKALEKHPQSKIQLIGHTDQLGSKEYNFDLSMQRVKTIKDYLIANGISADRFVESYKGEVMPRYKDDDRNRRVEVFIMGSDSSFN